MSSYTICPEVIKYSKIDRKYIFDILMVFIPNNSKKICIDSKNYLLEEYKKIIADDKDLADWLRFMTLYEDSSIEKIEINEEETVLPLEICKNSFDKQLIIHQKSTYSSFKQYIKENEIIILEKDLARYKLNYTVDFSPFYTFPQKELSPDDAYNIVLKICSEFKNLIEHNGLFKLLVDKTGKREMEAKAQLLFYGIAYSICEANDLKLSPEVDSGNGPVDFNLSKGFKANVNVEIKFADNSKLIKGYSSQLMIYNQAEHTDRSIYLIIKTNNNYDSKIQEIQKNMNEMKSKGEICPDIIIVDSTYKESASVR